MVLAAVQSVEAVLSLHLSVLSLSLLSLGPPSIFLSLVL